MPWLASQVGMVFQDPEAQIATLTVGDEAVFGMENLRLPPEEMPRRAAEALRQVDMLGMESTLTEALSGGQKQRLVLASTLAMGTSILVFDEPTANLDPAGGIEFFALLSRLKSAGALELRDSPRRSLIVGLALADWDASVSSLARRLSTSSGAIPKLGACAAAPGD